MESAAGAAAGRGASPPMPSTRKEWRAVSNSGIEELERSKLGQSDERTIYEVHRGTSSLDVSFCSIDGSLDSELLQQRLHSVSRRREELQQLEIELRAQVVAKAEVLEMQKSFKAQVTEQANAAAELNEQLQERDQFLHELERRMEEKDRELRAIKVDNAAAWAKEDLLREQDKELATFRRERDNSEAERAQHLKQIYDLKEHIHEKERQLLEMDNQHRAAKETIIYRDEQLREAQAWIARAQEMDALQSTTNHSLQAELRERTEQLNQLWLGCQRQFAEMERVYMHNIQQLQLELAEVRERSGVFSDESQSGHPNSKDVSLSKGNQFNVNEYGNPNGDSAILPSGNKDDAQTQVLAGDTSTKTDNFSGVPLVSSSLLGMGAFLPPGPITTLHPFVMHQQGSHSVPSPNSHIPQSHVSHFQPIPSISSHQQELSESSWVTNLHQYQPSLAEDSLLRSDAHHDFELPMSGHIAKVDKLDTHISPQQSSDLFIMSSREETQVLETNKQYISSQKTQRILHDNSSQFHETLRLDPLENHAEPKVTLENNVLNLADKSGAQDSANIPFQQRNDDTVGVISHSQEELGLGTKSPPPDANISAAANHQGSSTDSKSNYAGGVLSKVRVSSGQASQLMCGRAAQPTLLDERSLLACIVRAIPAGSGGQIRISTTLPNRLGKMLAPLHWHDYRKQYGKLDEFVARHPELFVIEGDLIHLREGAQKIISATTAAAKVAAAAAAVSPPYSSVLPSVAVTPVAQSHRLKRAPSANNQQSNGVCSNIIQGLSNVKILSKAKDHHELNGLSSEMRSGYSSVHLAVSNGSNNERTGLAAFQSKDSDGRHGLSFGRNQQERLVAGAAVSSKRY